MSYGNTERIMGTYILKYYIRDLVPSDILGALLPTRR